MRTLHYFYSIAALFLSLGFSSCCKSYGDATHITVSYEKYKKSEVDTILIMRYQSGSNYTILLDSFFQLRPGLANDTAYSDAFEGLYFDAEHIIKIPSVNKVLSFSDYKLETITYKSLNCPKQEVKAIKSFSFNGVTQSGAYYFVLPR